MRRDTRCDGMHLVAEGTVVVTKTDSEQFVFFITDVTRTHRKPPFFWRIALSSSDIHVVMPREIFYDSRVKGNWYLPCPDEGARIKIYAFGRFWGTVRLQWETNTANEEYDYQPGDTYSMALYKSGGKTPFGASLLV